MTILTICTIIAAILYLGSGMAIIGSMKGEGSGASSLIRWPVLAGLVMQGYALHGEMFGEGAVNFGFGFAMSEMFFFAVIILLIETWIHRLHGQFGIVLIAAAVGTLSPLLFTGQVIPSVEWTTIFRWHLLLAIAAYAFLMIAFVHAVLMALINRRLKSPAVGETSKFLDSMPALVVMERIFFRILVVGFLFITLTLIVGALATQEASCLQAAALRAGAPAPPSTGSGQASSSSSWPTSATASFRNWSAEEDSWDASSFSWRWLSPCGLPGRSVAGATVLTTRSAVNSSACVPRSARLRESFASLQAR